MAIKHVVRGAATETDTIVEHWIEIQEGLPVWMAKWGAHRPQSIAFISSIGCLAASSDSGSVPGVSHSSEHPGRIEVDP